MIQNLEIAGLKCMCSRSDNKGRIAYILYPMNILSDWITLASEKYDTTIVAITGMDWQNVFSPWPAKGVPAGDGDFKGESPEFLKTLTHNVIPQVEGVLGLGQDVERTLVGVSMSGLFALWQWMVCDTFVNIGSLSGSFWYEGFVNWMKNIAIPAKKGRGFFLLGDQESKTNVKEFRSVASDTAEVIALLKDAGIDVEFESVPGNHFSDPIPRLDLAFSAIYTPTTLKP